MSIYNKIIQLEKGSRQNLDKVELELNLKLPKDYSSFLIENNGADIENAYFKVKEINQVIPMGFFFGCDIKDGYADILEINNEYKDDILESSLLIGNDIGSGFLLLIFDGENDGVWYYDHTYFFKESKDDLNTFFIADSFADFMKMLEVTPPPTE